MRRRHCHRIPFAALLAFSLASPLCADQVVYFINGKAIMVKSVEKGEKFTVLEMDGGGKIGVPTDQIARIEDYVLSAPAAPQFAAPPAPIQAQAPAAVPAPAAAQPNPLESRTAGIPANMPPAAPMVPGPGVGGRPIDSQGRGMAGLRPIDVTGAAATQPPGVQRQPAQQTAGPAVGGPAGAYRGSAANRPNFNPAARRFNSRGAGMAGRGGGRPPDVNRYMAQPAGAQAPTQPASQPPAQAPAQPPAHEQQPAQQEAPPPDPPVAAEEDPPTATEPEGESQPPADPEDEKKEPEAPQPTEGETPDDSTGGAS